MYIFLELPYNYHVFQPKLRELFNIPCIQIGNVSRFIIFGHWENPYGKHITPGVSGKTSTFRPVTSLAQSKAPLELNRQQQPGVHRYIAFLNGSLGGLNS